MVLVLAAAADQPTSEVWLLERAEIDGRWEKVHGPIPAAIGKNGLARDEQSPEAEGVKREGDGRSPSGVFRVPTAFGYAAQGPPGLRLPWLTCTETLCGVDDTKSAYYNQIVEANGLPDRDWTSAEVMRREDGAYEFGAVIDYNPERTPGRGSMIFLHIWKGPGQGTAGCTAMAREDVIGVLTWLDPGAEPRLVLGVR